MFFVIEIDIVHLLHYLIIVALDFFFFKLGRVLHLLIKTFAYISSAES